MYLTSIISKTLCWLLPGRYSILELFNFLFFLTKTAIEGDKKQARFSHTIFPALQLFLVTILFEMSHIRKCPSHDSEYFPKSYLIYHMILSFL